MRTTKQLTRMREHKFKLGTSQILFLFELVFKPSQKLVCVRHFPLLLFAFTPHENHICKIKW